MVFMVCLTSGSLLLLLCIVHASNTTESTSRTENPQTLSIERSIETKSELKNLNKVNVSKYTDEDVENKVYPYKFSSTKPENATSIKLKKSESYTSTPEVNNGTSRLENGRSVDIDIEKIFSPDFYNAVFTPPISTKDHTSGYDTSQYGTENFGRLTTPSTPFFDKKYKEMVDSVNQKLEVDTDLENFTHPPNYTSDNFVEDIAKNPNGTKIAYKIFENIRGNETAKSGGVHKNVVLETQTILNIERKLNETTTYDEITPSDGINEVHKENLKYLLGDEQANEVKKEEGSINNSPSLRTSFQLTTKKYSITKPSTDKNDAGIISNKIESDTLKSLIATTTSSSVASKASSLEIQTKEATERNTNQVIDNQQETTSTISTSVKVQEQVYQENQIIPVHLSSPSTAFPTTILPSEPEGVKATSAMNKEEETTIKNENISVRNNTVEPEEQQSTTVLIIVQPNEQKKTTTEKYFVKEKTVTIASTPRGFSLPVSQTEKPTTESLTTVKNEESFAFTQFEDLITTIKDSSASNNINDIIGGKYTEDTTKDATTVDIETLEPTITKSSFTKYTISVSTDIPPTAELPTTLFSTTDESSVTNNPDKNTEPPINVMHMDEVTTSLTLEKLDQTTASSSSRGVIITEESPTTTEFPDSSTHQISSESISTLATNEGTTAAFTETTTFTEQGITTDFLQKFSTEMNTESPTTKTSIDISTSDGGTTTEFSPKTTFTLEQTTSHDLRFSKGMRFTEESSMVTEIMKDSTAETDVETSTSIQSESTQTVAKRVTIPVVEETTPAKEQGTTSGFTTESSLRITVTNVTEVTSTAVLSNFQTSSNATQKHEQSTENLAVNLTTLRLNKLYVTEVPESSGTSNEPITTDDNGHSSELEGGSGTIVAILISCVGGVCLVALACLLVVMRNRQKRFNYGQRCKPVSMDQYSVDSVSVFSSVRRKGVIRHSKRSYGNPAFEDPVCLSHPLNFPAISKFAANTEDVEAEFSDIPQIVARTSELPEGCETKNRFANVIPLPESRVFLTPMAGYPNSDYINANYVTGPKNTRKYYIACQAPMSNTVDDFWRMIWEQQCKVILMLTHLFENGAERCFDYLPPSEVLDCHRLFGDYQVTLKKREVKEKYIISSLQLKNMVSNSWREVTHFWYMGWPEKGVPVEANSIIAFLIEARSYMKSATMDKQIVLKPDVNGTCSPEMNPVVVHCSPGTGRTGTAITCDIAIREFEQTRQVDIPKIVYRIRRDRASAVQTKEQYAFIYKVIALYATKLAGGSLESI